MNVWSGSLTRSLLRGSFRLRSEVFRRQKSPRLQRFFHDAASTHQPFRLAIIGSGPAGFYSAHRIMTRIPYGIIDMYEQLPVPYGLVRFGVAPDHPEVKNCQDKFKEIAESPRFNFIGNVHVGQDVGLVELRNNYDAILFAYGASQDRKLGIPGEHLKDVYSARAFVGWYNGLPEYASLTPNLRAGDTAVVIGQGNVALDVARILSSGVDRLKGTDISEEALQVLADSTIKHVRVIGRRGPLQASFTIKEVRELMELPQLDFQPIDTSLLPPTEIKLPRVQKRITDLFRKHAKSRDKDDISSRVLGSISLKFMLAPEAFVEDQDLSSRLSSIIFTGTKFDEDQDPFDPIAKVIPTQSQYDVAASVAFRSIGYRAEPLPSMDDLGIHFDRKIGTINNLGGRVLDGLDEHLPGLYCAGWVKRGPTGVIATTMEDGFATAELLAEDWQGKCGGRHGWEALKSQLQHATNWSDWLKIDAAERERGKAKGKEREKFRSISEMLSLIH